MHNERIPGTYKFDHKPHVLIVEAPFYRDVVVSLREGALEVLKRNDVTYEIMDVPGALEIPAAISFVVRALSFDPMRRRSDGYIALGCVIKGDTMHDEIVGMESARGLQELALRYALAVGNGVLTCNTLDQALERALPSKQDRGGAAAEACLRMIEIKQLLRLSPRRRWVSR